MTNSTQMSPQLLEALQARRDRIWIGDWRAVMTELPVTMQIELDQLTKSTRLMYRDLMMAGAERDD